MKRHFDEKSGLEDSPKADKKEQIPMHSFVALTGISLVVESVMVITSFYKYSR